MASVEAAESLAQKRPSGTRIGGNEDRERRCLRGRKVQGPERLVPGEDEVEEKRRGDARHRHRGEHVGELLADRRAVHAGGLKDVLRDLLEIGEQHPHDDRQVAEAQDRDEADAQIEEAEVAVDEIDRHEHADGRHHLGREHPQKDVARARRRGEGHRPGRRHRDQHGDQRRAARDHDRVDGVMHIVAPALHGRVVLGRPMEEQEGRRRRKRLELGLEARQHHPQDGEEDHEADDPGGDRAGEDACRGGSPCHRLRPPDSCRRCARGRRPRYWRAPPPRGRRPRPCRRRIG